MNRKKRNVIGIVAVALVALIFIGKAYVFPRTEEININQSALMIDVEKQEIVEVTNIALKWELYYTWISRVEAYQGSLVIDAMPLTHDASFALDAVRLTDDAQVAGNASKLSYFDSATTTWHDLGWLEHTDAFEKCAIWLATPEGGSGDCFIVPLDSDTSYDEAVEYLNAIRTYDINPEIS